MQRERRWLFAGLAALAAVLLVGRAIAAAYVDYQWYASLGATALWWIKAENVVLLKGASLLVGGAFVFANLYAVRQSVVSVVLPRRVGDLEIGEEVSGRYLLGAVAATSLALTSLLTLPNADWVSLAAARLGVPFGESDPRFQADLGFWVYWLPLERALYARALLVLAVVIATVAFIYALTPSLRWERGGLRLSTYARRHLSVLSGFVLLVLAWSYRLDAFQALMEGAGPHGPVSWVDHKVLVPASLALALVTVLAGALVAATGWAGQTRLAFIAVTAVLVLSVGLRHVAPAIADRATGAVRAAREEDYVATRADYSRRAFAADRIELADSTVVFPTPAAAAAATPVWDADVLVRAVERTRRLGTVSGAPAVAGPVAEPRYLVAERPGGAAGGTAGAPQRWSIVRVAGAGVGPRGEPAAPSGAPIADDEAGTVPTALVFDSARGYLLVSDTGRQLAAVDAASGGARLALALSQQDLRLVTDQGAPARVVLRRDVRDRVDRLAPFFVQGAAVTPAVAGDSLYWLVHLYAASTSYPVSRPAAIGSPGWRYVRHAGVAVVHAFTGRMSIVASPPHDPITRSWMNAAPELFATWASFPDEVHRAVPPPVESGAAQAAAYAEFGPRGSEVPPAGTIRVPPADSAGGAPAPPVVLLPPDDGTPALSVPVTDEGGRVAGLVLVLGGAVPRTLWYAYPGRPDDPPFDAVLEQIRRAAGARPAAGDRVTAGAPRVLPVAGGVGYVVPRYAERGDGAPVLAGVGTAFAGIYADSRTATAAVAGGGAVAPAADSAGALRRARALYEAARAALRAGDWAAFGRAYEELGAALGRPRP